MDAGGGNTDTMFTIRVENSQTEITQIPRDSYVNSARFGPMKANALYAYGGTDAVKQELSRLMGRPIQHYILVNLEGIRSISDLMGGVTIDVPKRLYYVDNSQGLYIDLQPGRQVLKGRDLEGFLRWRNDGEGDFGRLKRQQLVIKSLFGSLTKPDNIMRLPALISAAGRNLNTDLGPMELGGLITAMGTTDLKAERLDATPSSVMGSATSIPNGPASPGDDPIQRRSTPKATTATGDTDHSFKWRRAGQQRSS